MKEIVHSCLHAKVIRSQDFLKTRANKHLGSELGKSNLVKMILSQTGIYPVGSSSKTTRAILMVPLKGKQRFSDLNLDYHGEKPYMGRSFGDRCNMCRRVTEHRHRPPRIQVFSHSTANTISRSIFIQLCL